MRSLTSSRPAWSRSRIRRAVLDPAHVRARHVVLGRGLGHRGEAVHFSQDGLLDLLRQFLGVDAVAQLEHFRLAVALHAELLTNRLELRAQQVLALALADVDLDLLGDLVLHDVARQGFPENLLHETQPRPHVLGGTDARLHLEGQVHVRPHEVGEAARARDVHAQDVDHLGGIAALGFHELIDHLHRAVDQPIHVAPPRLALLHGRDLEAVVGLGLEDGVQVDAPKALEHDLHGLVGHEHAVDHATRDPDGMEVAGGVGGLGLAVPREEARHEGCVAGGLLDHAQAARAIDLHGDDVEGEHDGACQAQAGQHVGDIGLLEGKAVVGVHHTNPIGSDGASLRCARHLGCGILSSGSRMPGWISPPPAS